MLSFLVTSKLIITSTTGVSTFVRFCTFSDDIVLSGSIAITGIATAETFSGYSNLQSIHSVTTKVFNVTVASKTSNHRYSGSGSGTYYIDGIESPFITLILVDLQIPVKFK